MKSPGGRPSPDWKSPRLASTKRGWLFDVLYIARAQAIGRKSEPKFRLPHKKTDPPDETTPRPSRPSITGDCTATSNWSRANALPGQDPVLAFARRLFACGFRRGLGDFSTIGTPALTGESARARSRTLRHEAGGPSAALNLDSSVGPWAFVGSSSGVRPKGVPPRSVRATQDCRPAALCVASRI